MRRLTGLDCRVFGRLLRDIGLVLGLANDDVSRLLLEDVLLHEHIDEMTIAFGDAAGARDTIGFTPMMSWRRRRAAGLLRQRQGRIRQDGRSEREPQGCAKCGTAHDIETSPLPPASTPVPSL